MENNKIKKIVFGICSRVKTIVYGLVGAQHLKSFIVKPFTTGNHESGVVSRKGSKSSTKVRETPKRGKAKRRSRFERRVRRRLQKRIRHARRLTELYARKSSTEQIHASLNPIETILNSAYQDGNTMARNWDHILHLNSDYTCLKTKSVSISLGRDLNLI